MSVECNAEKLTENPVISGWVERVALDEALPETAAQQAIFYAEQGIWQDALSTLATLRYHHPSNPAVTTDWQELMEAAGLERFSEQTGLYRSHYANVLGEHFDRVKIPETLDFSIIQAGLAY